jgi:hypothetical protein
MNRLSEVLPFNHDSSSGAFANHFRGFLRFFGVLAWLDLHVLTALNHRLVVLLSQVF